MPLSVNWILVQSFAGIIFHIRFDGFGRFRFQLSIPGLIFDEYLITFFERKIIQLFMNHPVLIRILNFLYLIINI